MGRRPDSDRQERVGAGHTLLSHPSRASRRATYLARSSTSGERPFDTEADVQGRIGTDRTRPTVAICGVLFDDPLTGGEPSFTCTHLAGPLRSLSDTEAGRLMQSAAEQRSAICAPRAQSSGLAHSEHSLPVDTQNMSAFLRRDKRCGRVALPPHSYITIW